jgi:hypothetical protein
MHDGSADHTWFIFNLHTKILFLYLHNMQSIISAKHLLQEIKKSPLTWKADVFLMVANPHPLWSFAW